MSGGQWWAALGWLAGTHPAALFLHPFSRAEGENKMKISWIGRKAVQWKKKKKKAKAAGGSKAKKKKRDLFASFHQQMMSSHFLGSKALVHRTVASEDESINKNVACLLSLSFYC